MRYERLSVTFGMPSASDETIDERYQIGGNKVTCRVHFCPVKPIDRSGVPVCLCVCACVRVCLRVCMRVRARPSQSPDLLTACTLLKRFFFMASSCYWLPI